VQLVPRSSARRSYSYPSYLPLVSLRLEGYEGGVRLDGAEVCEARWVALPDLRADVEAQPQRYTQVGGRGGGHPNLLPRHTQVGGGGG
jgi:hypothetical protein